MPPMVRINPIRPRCPLNMCAITLAEPQTPSTSGLCVNAERWLFSTYLGSLFAPTLSPDTHIWIAEARCSLAV